MVNSEVLRTKEWCQTWSRGNSVESVLILVMCSVECGSESSHSAV